MKLLDPTNIGTLEVKNRIVMPPMATGFASEDGEVTERLIRYYEERAKGGAGLIIVEFSAVEKRGRSAPLQLMISDDKFIPGLKSLAKAIKKHGAKACIQLQHGGIKTSARVTQIQPVGPSPFDAFPAGMGPAPRALSEKEIKGLVITFGEAARRASEAGFDAIELHCTHSYLIDQFMSARFNQRMDNYGRSIQNRARFACQILECMKEKVGEDYPIICRMTGDDYVEGGITLEDAKKNARLLVKSGADCLHVSVGISENMVSTPPMSFPKGCFVHLAHGIKKAVDVPIIAVGKIHDPFFAEQVLVQGKADLIAMGRALIADPFLPQKLEKGEIAEIIPCIACNQGCISRVQDGFGLTCIINPTVGKETEFRIKPAKNPRRVLIIGAGPAGLEAAIICKKKKHDVILAEKSGRLGGQLNYALRPPNKEDIKKLIDYFSLQIKKLRIKTYLNQYVNKEFVKEVKPDVIILATGSNPIVPEIPGIQRENVTSAIEVLEGKKIMGKKAIVIGGGQVGLETADLLAKAGKDVTILEMLADVGTDMASRSKMFLMKELAKANVNVLVNRKLREIHDKGVAIDHLNQLEEILGDAVVIAMGAKPERTLLQELDEIIPELEGFYIAGDSIEPRNALEAIHDGAKIARDI